MTCACIVAFSILLIFMNILTWNIQGAHDSESIRALRLLIFKYKPSIVVILEPRISGVQADRSIAKIGLSYSHRFKATGFSGGIWVLWDEAGVVEVLESNSQYIHCRVTDATNTFSYFTAIYGHLVPSRRNLLWQHLTRINHVLRDPWVLMGDFNSLALSSEHSGGSQNRTGVCTAFVEWLQVSGLIDLGFVGPQFTWRRGNLSQRLDRGLCNSAWRLKFPEASVSHLVRYHSDHRPLVLQFCSIDSIPHDKPFKFLQVWLTHEDFSKFVEDNWECEADFMDSIASFTEKL